MWGAGGDARGYGPLPDDYLTRSGSVNLILGSISSNHPQLEHARPPSAGPLQGHVVGLVVVADEGAPVEHLAEALDAVAHLDALAAVELAELEQDVRQLLGTLVEARVAPVHHEDAVLRGVLDVAVHV